LSDHRTHRNFSWMDHGLEASWITTRQDSEPTHHDDSDAPINGWMSIKVRQSLDQQSVTMTQPGRSENDISPSEVIGLAIRWPKSVER
jgi:hypothetical protein